MCVLLSSLGSGFGELTLLDPAVRNTAPARPDEAEHDLVSGKSLGFGLNPSVDEC